ncbi:NepR family anti-sigma factor [Sphingobium fontiphilum]|nr:NepR family anti-sigma factor [Sphingobium fontiphilum]
MDGRLSGDDHVSKGLGLVASGLRPDMTDRDNGDNSAIKGKTASNAAGDDNMVTQVLRNVYQTTVNEDIPAEMLDLLSKLD